MKRSRRLICLLLGILLCFSAVGCSKTEPENTGIASCTTLGKQPLQKVNDKEVTLTCDTLCCYGDEQFADNFDYLYGIPAEYVSDGFILYAASGGTADEVSLLQPADAGKGSYITNALQSRIAKRQQDFNGYNDKEVQKLDHAAVAPIGNRIALIVSDNPDAIAKTLRQILKQQSKQSENDK